MQSVRLGTRTQVPTKLARASLEAAESRSRSLTNHSVRNFSLSYLRHGHLHANLRYLGLHEGYGDGADGDVPQRAQTSPLPSRPSSVHGGTGGTTTFFTSGSLLPAMELPPASEQHSSIARPRRYPNPLNCSRLEPHYDCGQHIMGRPHAPPAQTMR